MMPTFNFLDNNSDEKVVAAFLKRLPVKHNWCVDIGASDGVQNSNTVLMSTHGWNSLLLERDFSLFTKLVEKYAHINTAWPVRAEVTPSNVVPLLDAYNIPKEFDFLNLDIDGYDYDVLDALLNTYRPTLICTEVSEILPPPVKFKVFYRSDFTPEPASHRFFGYSLSSLEILCKKHAYSLIWLEYNNAFIVPNDIAASHKIECMSPEVAFTRGYIERPTRLERYPWNREFEHLRDLSPEEVVAWVNKRFAAHAGEFECYL